MFHPTQPLSRHRDTERVALSVSYEALDFTGFSTQNAQIPFALKLFSALWVSFLTILWGQRDSYHTIVDCIKYSLNPTRCIKIWCLGPV